jgi:hypothetical protein
MVVIIALLAALALGVVVAIIFGFWLIDGSLQRIAVVLEIMERRTRS